MAGGGAANYNFVKQLITILPSPPHLRVLGMTDPLPPSFGVQVSWGVGLQDRSLTLKMGAGALNLAFGGDLHRPLRIFRDVRKNL